MIYIFPLFPLVSLVGPQQYSDHTSISYEVLRTYQYESHSTHGAFCSSLPDMERAWPRLQAIRARFTGGRKFRSCVFSPLPGTCTCDVSEAAGVSTPAPSALREISPPPPPLFARPYPRAEKAGRWFSASRCEWSTKKLETRFVPWRGRSLLFAYDTAVRSTAGSTPHNCDMAEYNAEGQSGCDHFRQNFVSCMRS